MTRGAHPKELIVEDCEVNPELTRARNGVDGLGIVQGCLQFVQPNRNVWDKIGRKQPQEELEEVVGSEYGEYEPNPVNDSHFNEEDRNQRENLGLEDPDCVEGDGRFGTSKCNQIFPQTAVRYVPTRPRFGQTTFVRSIPRNRGSNARDLRRKPYRTDRRHYNRRAGSRCTAAEGVPERGRQV